MRRPGAFEAAGHRVAADAAGLVIHPAETLLFDIRTLRGRAEVGRAALAVRLADGMAAGRQRDGFLVVHRHAGESHAYILGRLERVGLAVDAFGVYVDQAHHHGGEGVFQIAFAGIAAALAAARGQPFLLGTPVGVLLGMPDVFAAEAETEGLQAHRLVGQGAGQEDQVGPADLVAVLLLDRPEQATRLVQVGVVGPGVDRRETLVARAAAATAVGDAVGARRVPGHADHQAAVVAPVGRPPVLAVGHQRLDIFLERLDVELLEFLAIVEARAQRVGLRVVLVQDVQVQGLGPPVHVGHIGRGHTAVHDGTFACVAHGDSPFA